MNAFIHSTTPAPGPAQVRAMQATDLPEAGRIMRLAFGTFLDLPDPMTFLGDADFVASRWHTDPHAAFAAERDGALVGSNFACRWGSVGFFGPLSIHPQHWGQKTAQRLLEPVMECFMHWDTRLAGLFTFAESPLHVGLYQKFGFWPRHLTAIMARPVSPASPDADIPSELHWTTYASLPELERDAVLATCTTLTDSLYEGLDLGKEIRSVHRQQLGDTLLLWESDRLAGMAVCHCGPNSEGGSGTCYLKFAMVREDSKAARNFDRLLQACNDLASRRGLDTVLAGVNTARVHAYRLMLTQGFRTQIQGVCMQQSSHRTDDPGYNRPGVFAIDDWR